MKKLILLSLLLPLGPGLFAQLSTVKQVFNFSAGDTFEYVYSAQDFSGGGGVAGHLLEVIDAVNTGADTNSYACSIFLDTTFNNHISPSYPDYCPFPNGFQCNGGVNFQVYDFDSLVFYTPLMDLVYGRPCDTPYCQTATSYAAAYNGRKQNIITSMDMSTIREVYVDSIGLAMRNNFIEGTPSTISTDTLIYYYKAATGERWGQFTPVLSTAVQNIPQLTTGVYPNPASENFTFSISQLLVVAAYLKVYDMAGKEIKSVAISSLKTNVSCQNLAAGVYYWQLESSGTVMDRGKLAVR